MLGERKEGRKDGREEVREGRKDGRTEGGKGREGGRKEGGTVNVADELADPKVSNLYLLSLSANTDLTCLLSC